MRHKADHEHREGSRGAAPSYVIVYPPRAGTGLRHAVNVREDRTLCGVFCDEWYTEAVRFDAATIGCRRCRRAHELAALEDYEAP